MTTYNYYYNNVPGKGLCRNNLIYTSLISEDKKTFVQWYHNDTEYHRGQNQVVDPELMKEKWARELMYLMSMQMSYPDLIPKIKDVDIDEKKIFLEIDGVDFWQRQLDGTPVPDDWQDQMISILEAHRSLGLYKYSLHPSSYFIVDGKLKSINYFFTYRYNEGPITVRDHISHISEERQKAMKPKTDALGIDWDEPQSVETMQILALESFRDNYPDEFIERAKRVFQGR
jgi:hypothetical protein